MMDKDMTAAEMRRELQSLLSEERELVDQVVSATTSGDYARLRDLADRLMKLAERRSTLRAAFVEARAREAAAQPDATERRGGSDQAEDTWRRLR
jgi:DNA replication initiation complex subunit (GINS family)